MKAAALVAFLSDIGGTLHVPPTLDLEQLVIDSVTTDTAARTGQAAWISPRVFNTTPSRLLTFAGSLLVCPAAALAAAGSWYVACGAADPKRMFAAMLDTYFTERAQIAWPDGLASVAQDARIGQGVVLGPGVVLGSRTVVEDGVTIGPNTVIANAVIGERARIGANCSIGLAGFGYAKDASGQWVRFPHVGGVVIEADVEVGSNTCIDRGSLGDTVVRRGSKIDNLVHIAHNCDVGPDALVIANSMIGGSTVVGAGAWVAPSSAINNQLVIGPEAVVGTGAVVVKNVAARTTVVGNPARPLQKQSSTE